MSNLKSPVYADASIATTGDAFYQFKEFLKTAGWTVVASGDGSGGTYGASSDVLTGGGTGAGGAGNDNAWIVLKQPTAFRGLQRQFCIQNTVAHTTNNSSQRWKYSRNAGFTGGSPSATQVPSAADEVVIAGGGTDAAPTGDTLWVQRGSPASVTTRFAGVADTYEPHGFAAWCYQDESGGELNTTSKPRIIFDPLISTRKSGATLDTDPYAIHVNGAVTTQTLWDRADVSEAGASRAFSSTAAAAYSQVNAFYFAGSSSNNAPTNMPADLWSTNYSLLPVLYGDATVGVKGVSSMLLWVGQTRPSVTNRDVLFTVNGETKGYWYHGDLAVPWNGSDPTIGSGSWNEATADVWTLGQIGATIPPFLILGSLSQTMGNMVLVAEGLKEKSGDLSLTLDAIVLAAQGQNVVADSTPPVITNFSPATGTNITNTQVLSFDITDNTSLASVVLIASFPDGTVDLIHDGDTFRGKYTGSVNTRVAISGGYTYTIKRDGGWIGNPTLEFVPVDTSGNIGEIP